MSLPSRVPPSLLLVAPIVWLLLEERFVAEIERLGHGPVHAGGHHQRRDARLRRQLRVGAVFHEQAHQRRVAVLGGDVERRRADEAQKVAAEAHVSLDDLTIEDPTSSPRRDQYAEFLWDRRQRKGMSRSQAQLRVLNGNYFGSCMVACGDADALVSGVGLHYPETIRPALEVIGAHPKAGLVSGVYMLVFERRLVFISDATVNIDPTAEQLERIGFAAARIAKSIGHEPRVAFLSFSNFGSVRHPEAEKMSRAAELLRRRDPSLVVDGEMQADTAFDPEALRRDYPFSMLKEEANVLIFPNLSAANIAYKLLSRLGGATAIGPILTGMRRPVHVLQRGADVQEIVNMTAVAVVDAQERTFRSASAAAVGAATTTPTILSRL